MREALRLAGLEAVEIGWEQVRTQEEAEQLGFHGSPAILIDGRDPFERADAPVGLACRLYDTPDGPQGAPSLEQLRHVFAA